MQEKYKDYHEDLTITFKLLMMLLRQYKIMDVNEINKFLKYKNIETCGVILKRIIDKTKKEVNKYTFKYKNDKGEEFTKTFYYFGELDHQKLILAGGKYTKSIRAF